MSINLRTTRFYIVFIAILMVAIPVVAFAQDQALENKSTSGSDQLFCKRDFGNFLTNGIDFDGEGFWDYWGDIIDVPFVQSSRYGSNYCWYSDIDSLLNRIDKARKQLRQAFYVCDSSTVARVTDQYYQMSAEVYYLRHYVEINGPADADQDDDAKAQNVALRAEIRQEFLDKFVKDLEYFDMQNGIMMYNKLKDKYKSKLETYRNCEDPNWGVLKEKLRSFSESIKTIEQLGSRFADKVEKRVDTANKRVAENPGLITSPWADSGGDAFKRIVDFRINGETPEDATVWEQISNTYKDNSPLTYGDINAELPAVNFGSISNDLEIMAKRDENINLDLVYLAEYDLKYRRVEGAGANMALDNLLYLRKTIEASFQPINQVAICTANIVGKQCGGK